MILYYVTVDSYGLYIFSAANINAARYHLEDVLPQYDFEIKNIIELNNLTAINLENNWITLVPQRKNNVSSNWKKTY